MSLLCHAIYIFQTHEPIMIFFGRTTRYFLTSPNFYLALHGKQETRKLHLFTWVLHTVLSTNTQNT